VNVPIYNESTKNLIHNLRESINEHNKKKDTHSKKHKIILIGDSHIKGYASNLKSLLSNNYDFFIIFKPGSTTNELMESAKKEINQLPLDDAIIICSGTNDYEPNKFSLTHHNIMNFVKSNDHTNIILINVPFRYDLPNSRSANNIISVLNRKLQKLAKTFPYMSFLKTDNDRNLFTNHGLYLNKLVK
jgi:hypothetical protein